MVSDDALADAIHGIHLLWGSRNVDQLFGVEAQPPGTFESFLAAAIRGGALEAHGVLVAEQIDDCWAVTCPIEDSEMIDELEASNNLWVAITARASKTWSAVYRRKEPDR